MALLAFLTVSMSIVVGYQLVNMFLARNSERMRERLAEEFGKAEEGPTSSPLYRKLDQLSLDPDFMPTATAEAPPRPLVKPTFMERVSAWLDEAGLSWHPAHLFGLMAILAGLAGCVGVWFGGKIAGPIVAILAAIAPLIYVHLTWKARRERYLKQLPNAFELMARVIKAGQSVPQALQSVADAFDDPLASGFRACLQKQNLGMRPEVAFQAMAEASGIIEMRIFAMAMLIQRQTGGNLSEVLERLAGLVRARLKLRQQVKTLTAEGRLQGGTLVVLPFVIMGVLMFINRGYVEVLFQHVSLLVATGVSMLIGILWIRKVVNIDS
jgi:tight adherence protein B